MQFAPEKIDEAFYDRLRQHYTEAEIVELGSFIGFNVGYHTFFRTLDFYPMFAPDGNLVSQEDSRRIYGDRPGSHLNEALLRALAETQSATEIPSTKPSGTQTSGTGAARADH